MFGLGLLGLRVIRVFRVCGGKDFSFRGEDVECWG